LLSLSLSSSEKSATADFFMSVDHADFPYLFSLFHFSVTHPTLPVSGLPSANPESASQAVILMACKSAARTPAYSGHSRPSRILRTLCFVTRGDFSAQCVLSYLPRLKQE
ncbi:MAG: hypothetical protein ACRCT0_10495, partial [Plesiomonas shigelloides]